MVSITVHLQPPQWQRPGEHGTEAGESSDSEKRGAERVADLGMKAGLPGRRQARNDLRPLFDDAAEQGRGAAVARRQN